MWIKAKYTNLQFANPFQPWHLLFKLINFIPFGEIFIHKFWFGATDMYQKEEESGGRLKNIWNIPGEGSLIGKQLIVQKLGKKGPLLKGSVMANCP